MEEEAGSVTPTVTELKRSWGDENTIVDLSSAGGQQGPTTSKFFLFFFLFIIVIIIFMLTKICEIVR